MALSDILSESGNITAIIELFSLFFIVMGFFRWYDSKYQHTIHDTKDEIMKHIDDAKDILCQRISHIDQELVRLDDRFHQHINDNDRHHHYEKG